MKSRLCLDQLWKAARAAESEPLPEMPDSLATRVWARSRFRNVAEDPILGLIPLFRRAFALGMAIMVVAIAWSYADPASEADDEALANFEVRADVLP